MTSLPGRASSPVIREAPRADPRESWFAAPSLLIVQMPTAVVGVHPERVVELGVVHLCVGTEICGTAQSARDPLGLLTVTL